MIHAHPDDMLAAAMMATAKAERRAAAKRDGMHPGAMPQCARHVCISRAPSPEGRKARDLIEANPGMTAAEVSARTGIAPSTARGIIRSVYGALPPGKNRTCTKGVGRTSASFEAERLLREGVPPSQVNARTGLSRTQIRRLKTAIAAEGAA